MEAEFVRWLSEQIPSDPRVPIGVGDDAAVVLAGDEQQVVAADLLCEGVHFRMDQTPLELIGRKALAVNLSDLAAMAAQPQFAIVSLLWPSQHPWQEACAVYEGLLRLAHEFKVALIGGDTNRWDGPLVINVTVIGRATERGVLQRNGSCVGDAILVTGPLGGSLQGRHLDFQPRVSEALTLHDAFDLHAAIDISDGLLLDLSRMMAASGTGAELDLDAIPITNAAQELAAKDSSAAGHDSLKSPLQRALSDGEDFELILTTDASTAEQMLATDRFPTLQLTRIGKVIDQPGLYQRIAQGRQPLTVAGYQH